jgi:triacylglycerol lipase
MMASWIGRCRLASALTFSMLTLAPVAALAQVPKDIAAKLCAMGRVVDPAGTAALYRPLHPSEPYKGVTVARGVPFGPDPDNVVDVFTPAGGGGGARPVLIFVSGGAGNRKEGPPPAGPLAEGGDAFYDNIMLWAVKNGMIGVNMERRAGGARGAAPPAPAAIAPTLTPPATEQPAPAAATGVPPYDNAGAADVAALVQWVRFNALKYNGNPNRIFIWAHSAGNGPVAGYIGHPELYAREGVGLKGAVLMSGQFSMFPLVPPPPARDQELRCPAPPGGGRAAGANGRGAGGQDLATQLSNSNLIGFLKSDMAFAFVVGELDTATPAFGEFMRKQLCAVRNCPATAVVKDHSHMSLVFSPNTEDDSVTGPMLRWIRSIK